MKPRQKTILADLRQEIAIHDTPDNRHNYQRFHKEILTEPEGLRAPVLRQISNRTYRKLRQATTAELVVVCDSLLASNERYMRFFAFDWAFKRRGKYARSDFSRFERWLKRYVDNWGSCDHLGGVLGHYIAQFPDMVSRTKRWTNARHRLVRRQAAVCLIVPVRQRMLLDEVFDTADRLLTDADDLVQKGYGWMLKEASNEFPDEVFGYVMRHKASMPRTALRYAIEKLPPARRKEAMRR